MATILLSKSKLVLRQKCETIHFPSIASLFHFLCDFKLLGNLYNFIDQ